MKRILLTEDEAEIAHLLSRGLTFKGFNVIVAHNGREALEKIQHFPPDLIILDVMLPDIDGFEVCQRLRAMEYTELPIVMLTAKDEVADKVAGLDCDADDFIVKPFDFEELLARIRAALRRRDKKTKPTQKIVVGDLMLDSAARQVYRAGKLLELTMREYDLLELLARNAGRVLTKERIFELVWGYDNKAGWEVIKVCINHVRAKLNEGGQSDLIHSVRGIGYMLSKQGSREG